ncbi:MAG TPA: response regulator, partial [Acidimicrobiales bacterium]|nr:response regulator [Acidimicrobiales bacterium]
APGAPGAPGAGAESGPGAGPAGAGDAGAATAGAAPTAGTTTELRPEPPPASARTTQARRRDRGQDTIRVPLARLDELSRLIGEAGAAHARAVAALVEDLGGRAAIPADLHVLEGLLHDLQDRTSRTRMVPVARVVEPLRRAVRDVARAQGKDVRFDVAGDETELDRGILDTLADPLLHLVRNAVDHGIEPAEVRAAQGKPEQAQVRLAAAATASSVVISVGDDGRGLDLDRIRAAAAPTTTTTHAAAAADPIGLLFQPGFSTAAQVTDVSGRGVGLDVVRSTLETLSGRIDVHSEPGRGCVFTITVPLTMASVACLVLKAGGRPYAIPLDNVAATVEPQPDHRSLADVLGVPVTAPPTAGVVVTDGRRTATFAVASVVDHRGLVVRGLGRIMPPLPVVAGAALQADGSVVVVLDPAGLLDRAAEARTAADEARHAIPPANAAATPQAAGRPHRILVVDDSAVVRQTQHAVLTRAGYEVQTAVDGADALARLQEWPADLALVDVRMPVMDGLALTAALRADPRFAGIAVLIVTSRATDEDRRRGMEAGADGYVVKGTFTSDHLLDAVAGLLGQDR